MRWPVFKSREQPWCQWFAWRPVKLESDERAWLEVVERKLCFPYVDTRFGSFFRYRKL